MSGLVLLGDEAVALGAIDAGISAAYGYPGTPSTEIMEYILKYAEKNSSLNASWCSNEKTAYEEALGASFAGKRSIVTMKHVGLNVAADPFINSALLKIEGGLVLAVADDPGMHSSQNEQDSRYYADFARIICFEPADQQEAYNMTHEAFEISEKYHIPVMLRLVTRLSHSRAAVKVKNGSPENALKKSTDPKRWMLLPALARKNWSDLLSKQKDFLEYSEASDYNNLDINPDFKDFGIITTGLGRNYYNENLKELKIKPSHLHIGVYPIPVRLISELAGNVKRVVVLEEGYPLIENRLRGLLSQSLIIDGKENRSVPIEGELTPDNIRNALGLCDKKGKRAGIKLPQRPPQLCRGCPHADTYNAINKALLSFKESIVTSDIGCYSLGALPPYSAIDTIVCMGASIGIAKGSADAGFHPVVAAIGDSTFLHSGITSLVDAVSENTPITVVILDNSAVAMTGGQKTILPSSKLKKLVEGIGVDKEHIRIMVPLKKNLDKNADLLKKEIDYKGVSVVISVRECIETLKHKRKTGAADEI